MKTFKWTALLCSLGALAAGCSDSPKDGFYFAGHARDGVTGDPITQYEIELQWLDRTIEGNVDDDGRYFLGPLAESHDYTVSIEAPGYRPFTSHNAMRATPPTFGVESRIFDAYLFPTDLESPRTRVEVFFNDQEARPSGKVRLRPVSGSVLFDEPRERPASVGAQVWTNDEDILNSTVLVDLQDGVAEVEEGALVYGVAYDVTVVGVPGYKVANGGRLTAGIDQFTTTTLSQFDTPPLELTFNSVDRGPVPVDNVNVTLIFNQDIEFDPTKTENRWAEMLDNSVFIETRDDDGDGEINQLRTSSSPDEQERGTSINIEGNRIELAWSTDGLETRDMDDRIRQVVFQGLDNIGIRPVSGGTGTFTTIGAFTGPNLAVPLAASP